MKRGFRCAPPVDIKTRTVEFEGVQKAVKSNDGEDGTLTFSSNTLVVVLGSL